MACTCKRTSDYPLTSFLETMASETVEDARFEIISETSEMRSEKKLLFAEPE